jgi:hypothetical protein
MVQFRSLGLQLQSFTVLRYVMIGLEIVPRPAVRMDQTFVRPLSRSVWSDTDVYPQMLAQIGPKAGVNLMKLSICLKLLRPPLSRVSCNA